MNDVHREGKGFQGEIYGGLLKVVRQQNRGDQLAIAMVSGEGWRCPLEKDEEFFLGGRGKAMGALGVGMKIGGGSRGRMSFL